MHDVVTRMILVDYMHDSCWLHAWCFLMKHMMLIDQTHDAWFRSLYDALECSTIISHECLMMLDALECSSWISREGLGALECLMMLDVAWWCLMMLDDAWWCLMMLDDAWWCLMMLDDAWWCLMKLDDAWWCLTFWMMSTTYLPDIHIEALKSQKTNMINRNCRTRIIQSWCHILIF